MLVYMRRQWHKNEDLFEQTTKFEVIIYIQFIIIGNQHFYLNVLLTYFNTPKYFKK